MRIKLFLILLFLSTNIYCYQISNKNLPRVDFGVTDYLFAPAYFKARSNLAFNFDQGDLQPKLIFSVEANLSKLFNPLAEVTFEFSSKVVSDFIIKNRFQIIRYFHVYLGCFFQNYSNYDVVEHNLYTTAEVRIPVKNFFLFRLNGGVNFKFIDYDTTNFGSKRFTDYNIAIFPIIELGVFFFVTKYYGLGVKFSNLIEDKPQAFGSLGVELEQDFNISRDYSVHFDVGVSFAGSGAVAGFPNRVWFAIGGSYIYWFNK